MVLARGTPVRLAGQASGRTVARMTVSLTLPRRTDRHGLSLLQLLATLGALAVLAGVTFVGHGYWQGRQADAQLAETLVRYSVDTGRAVAELPAGFADPLAPAAASPTGLDALWVGRDVQTDTRLTVPGNVLVGPGAQGQVLAAVSRSSSGRCVTVRTALGARGAAVEVGVDRGDGCALSVPASPAGLPAAPPAPEPQTSSGGFQVAFADVARPDADLLAASAAGELLSTADAPEDAGEIPTGAHLYRRMPDGAITPVRDGFARPVPAPERWLSSGQAVAYPTSRQLTSTPIASGQVQVAVVTAAGGTPPALLSDGAGPLSVPAGTLTLGALDASGNYATIQLDTHRRQAAPGGWWRLSTDPAEVPVPLPFDADTPVAISADGTATAGSVDGRLTLVVASEQLDLGVAPPAAPPIAVSADTVVLAELTASGVELTVVRGPDQRRTVRAARASAAISSGALWFPLPDGLGRLELAGDAGPSPVTLPGTATTGALQVHGVDSGRVVLSAPAADLASGCRAAAPLVVTFAPAVDAADLPPLRLPAGAC